MDISRDEALGLWRDRVIDRGDEIDPHGEYCWESLALGYFLGMQFSLDVAEDMVAELRQMHLL